MWMAPVCSSFVFANIVNTKRTAENLVGDETYQPVSLGNLMARIAVFLMAVAAARNVEAAIENPISSMIFRYPPVAEVLQELQVAYALTDCCRFSKKPYGQRFLKQFKFAATGTWINRVVCKCRCPGGLHVALMTTNENGSVSGTPALKKSQAYPLKLGESIVAAWLAGEQKPMPKVKAKSLAASKAPKAPHNPNGTAVPSAPTWTRPSASAVFKRPCAAGPAATTKKIKVGGEANWQLPTPSHL